MNITGSGPTVPTGLTPPPPVERARATRRRLPVWAWVLIGIVALAIGVLLSPIFAVIFLVVLITGIVALVKNTPTWLRFRDRKVATWVTAVSAVAFLITGSLANVVLPGSANEEPTAIAETPAVEQAPTPTSTPTRAPKPTPTPTPETLAVTLTSVVDGDTIDTSAGKVRLIGIDTPEVGAWGYDQATAELSAFLATGALTLVAVDLRDDTDRYGRLLRYVQVGGKDAGAHMIETGWAIAKYDSRDGYGGHPLQPQYVTVDAQHEMPAQPAPAQPAAAPAQPAPVQPAPAPAQPAPAQPAPAPAPADVYYKNCDAVRAAGAAPIYQGQPGYASHLDRDKDGIGCDT